MNRVVAKRYAKAFFDHSRENKKLKKSYQDVCLIEETVSASGELKAVLADPTLGTEEQKNILSKIFGKNIDKFTVRFLHFLAEKKRTDHLSLICGEFKNMYYKEENIQNISVESHVKLSDTQLRALTHHLKLKLRKEISASTQISSEILGGMRIKVDDLVYDSTVRSMLDKFKRNVLHHS